LDKRQGFVEPHDIALVLFIVLIILPNGLDFKNLNIEYHNQVKNALIQDGWVILTEDYTLEYDGDRVYVDIAAEQPVSAAKGGRMILVEVKSFLGQSFIRDLELAVGQYILYRDVLTETQQYVDLYLGIPSDAYWTGFQKSLSQLLVQRNRVKLLVVDINREVIEEWID
jgi:hypothetical protein